MYDSVIACAIGTRARPQKNSSAIAAVIAPRIVCSRIPRRVGRRAPLAAHAPKPNSADTPVRQISAL